MAEHGLRTSATGGRRVTHTETRLPIERIIANVVYFIFTVIIVLLALRFLLLLFGANSSAPFTQMIYALTAPLMAPFFAVFGTTKVNGSTFEWSALLAIAIYALLAWGIGALIDAVTPRASAGTVETNEVVEGEAEEEREGYYRRR